VKTFTET